MVEVLKRLKSHVHYDVIKVLIEGGPSSAVPSEKVRSDSTRFCICGDRG